VTVARFSTAFLAYANCGLLWVAKRPRANTPQRLDIQSSMDSDEAYNVEREGAISALSVII
jgi:hypothetical protein